MRVLGLTFQKVFKMSKINYPSADRNKDPILGVLQKYFDGAKKGKVLEVASGTGQHSSFFAKHFPKLQFQPTEYDTSLFGSIKAYADDTPTKNVNYPVQVDVCATWNVGNDFDYLICINMIHITPFECTVGLFKNGSRLLKSGGLMVTYGPYAYKGAITPQSNIDFDRGLRAQNSSWGLRDIIDLEKLANSYRLQLLHIHDMPSNNKCLIWKKLS